MRFIYFRYVFIWKERKKRNKYKYKHQQREKEGVRVGLGFGLVVLHQGVRVDFWVFLVGCRGQGLWSRFQQMKA